MPTSARGRIATLVLLACLGGAVVWRDKTTSAADTDVTAWGASDPTWSPDGKRLAFSLFGSIWTVSTEGGTAEQLTSSTGYHAHPAWSPAGGQIAFISGASPAGLLPNVGGRLAIVDVSTGAERIVETRYPTAGTPAWTAEGKSVICALQVPQTGAILHEVPLTGEAARPLQSRPQRGQVSGWSDASVGVKAREIYFTGIRNGAVQNGSQQLGAPQVWSMPVTPSSVMVQLPLTRYRLTDIAQIHSLSAIPDGSGVVYSAVSVNGKGDRELYRVSREGGSPVAITNTPRDEFAPSVSPDGKLVAHVSNHLGNIDLFVMPIGGGEKRHVRISQLKFRRPGARIRIKALDERGDPTPVRLYVRASDGKAYGPRGSAMFYFGLDPGQPREGFFVADGDDEFDVPAGQLRLVAIKGVEYRIEERSLEVPAGSAAADVTIAMQRWTNWAQKGWYTGENHFHANYNGSYYQRPPDSLRWLEAEDLNTANMIVANSEGAFIHDKEFFKGVPDPVSKPRYVLYWGQEYRNSDPLGHQTFLNIKKQVPPSFTSVVGSNSPYDYPLNTMGALEAKKQGGMVVYVHPISGTLTDVFDTNLGAKEAPLGAALDAVDGIDLLPFAPASYELWYRLLNCGFRISPGAGTDVFTNWRGINRIPGMARQYVQLNGDFRWDRWVERYREGRVFVTNAPLLTFEVNGHPMGSVVPASAPGYRVQIAATVQARVPLEQIEIVQNGEVIESRRIPAGSTDYRVEKEVTVDRSSWFAVRVAGPAVRGLPVELARAHSAPVYVHVGGRPVIVKEDVELMIRWLNRLWASLDERNNFGPGANRERARAMFDRGLAHYRAKLN